MKRLRIPILLMLFGVFAMAGGGFSFRAVSRGWAGGQKPVIEWIAAHAVRLKTPEAGHGFADMEPLKKIIGDARIVSFGEATHGTREFFQLKHRMLEFLATEMGFTIFSIEANMPEAYRLNDFVLNGNGDPAKLIKGMYFWTWNTQEVLDMVLWMREFNKSGKGRVQFTGFDMQTPNVAMDIVRDFVARCDPQYAGTVRLASDLTNATSSPSRGFGVKGAALPVMDGAVKRVHLSGYIKTEGVNTGYAGLWLRVDSASGMLALDNMSGRGATGTGDWKRYDVELSVAPEARSIVFGPIFPGNGIAWFDGLTIELDGVPYMDTSVFDPDFESPTLRGFSGGGADYQVELDNQVFHSGKQSLRMKRVAASPAAPNAIEPRFAVSAWKEVVSYLERSREAYRGKGISAGETDWAIQNARVVLQCNQLRTNEASRDGSMADNIKWILDNNPGAKIVLWAHNGHVSTANIGGFEPMGASLRKVYGGQMVVFGFAFNQGSFQSREQVGGVLRDFTVPPAPEGSLDATMAATGIPLFALDLRDAPKSGPVAAWLSEKHKTRSIGAMYSEDLASQFFYEITAPRSFDVMLFAEKTTAARKNP